VATARAERPSQPPTLEPLKMHEQKGLRVDALSQAPEFARPLRPHWVASLARTWNPRLCGEVLVSKRPDGSYRLLTGNHRWAAKLLRKEGADFFNCLVYYGLTVEEEAEVYLAQDKNRLRHTAADDFLAMVTQGDPVALGIQAIVDDLGLHITPYGLAGYGKTRIRAVSALLRTWETAGAGPLEKSLELIRDEWLPGVSGGPSRRTAFSEATILPLAVFIKLYSADPAFRMANLRAALERDGLGEYERKYMAQRSAAAARPTAGVATLYGVLALVDTYNYGRRLDNRLDETVARKSAQTRFGEERANLPYQSTGKTPQADAKRFIATLEAR
jgi:hypothetical protein